VAKLPTVTPERVVDLRPRTILRVLFIVLAVAITLEVIWIARHVLAWVVIALFLALAVKAAIEAGEIGLHAQELERFADELR